MILRPADIMTDALRATRIRGDDPKAGATNMRKTPLYTAMESLRKDIATYSDRLCLNPKSIESVNIEIKTPSRLEMALEKLEG